MKHQQTCPQAYVGSTGVCKKKIVRKQAYFVASKYSVLFVPQLIRTSTTFSLCTIEATKEEPKIEQGNSPVTRLFHLWDV